MMSRNVTCYSAHFPFKVEHDLQHIIVVTNHQQMKLSTINESIIEIYFWRLLVCRDSQYMYQSLCRHINVFLMYESIILVQTRKYKTHAVVYVLYC